MGTGLEIIVIASLITAAATAAIQIDQAQKTAKAQTKAAEANLRLAEAEGTRQRKEVTRLDQEAKSDIVRRADAELGAILAQEGEFGASPSSFARLTQEVSFLEGIDLSRTDSNRESRLGSIDSQIASAQQGATNSINFARNAEKSAITGAVLGFVGSSLQIAGGFAANKASLAAAKNLAPSASSLTGPNG